MENMWIRLEGEMRRGFEGAFGDFRKNKFFLKKKTVEY